MQPKGYLIFHLNLGFSSIEEEARPDVMQKCYTPLLDLVEETGIPIGIELTGWTLMQIEAIDISWIERLKLLLNNNDCELIGSGYCQIIGPLVPYSVNEWNQRLGLQEYSRILGIRPNIALVNEMAYSNSLVELYKNYGYRGFVADRDNMRLALDLENIPMNLFPTHAEGTNFAILPVLWSDSILFQKFQHYAHGDISIVDYLNYLKKRVDSGEKLIPIYCNDAEGFDYRPGRFNTERPMHTEGEWNRVEKLLECINSNTEIDFISPTQALKISKRDNQKTIAKIENAAYPIPVKKQAKYNIARWSVTGRNDIFLNTMCHRIERFFTNSKNNNENDWRLLCELWASDLRTHITDKRWGKAERDLESLALKHSIDTDFHVRQITSQCHEQLNNVIGDYGCAKVSLDEEEILLNVSTKNITLNLNLRRGLTIQNLAFISHEMESCIGTLPHGYFSCISLGADHYSGGVVIEFPLERTRITDLERVRPTFRLKTNGNIEIQAEIKTKFGSILKVVEVFSDSEKISLSYNFSKVKNIPGSVRVGTITLLNSFSTEETELLCANGGKEYERFDFSGQFDHSEPSSSLVSSSRGLGATNGIVQVISNEKKIQLQWDPSECAAIPMLQNTPSEDKTLSRIFFSINEMDDTSRKSIEIKPFKYSISSI